MSVNSNLDDIVEDQDEEEESDLTRFLPKDDEDDVEKPPLVTCISPSDRWWGVYVIFYFLGITTLLPWNFFINADKYWMYKFRDVNETSLLIDDRVNVHGKTSFQASFFSYLAIASNLPSTICFMVNFILAKFISANVRIVLSLAITFLMFLLATILVQVDTDQWQEEFFITTLVMVVIMNAFCSFFQCGLLCVVGRFPPEYTTATMSGQALGGIFAAVANIMSIFMSANQVKSAFIYFILGSTSLLISLIASIVLPKTLFYKFHTGDKNGFRFLQDYPTQAMIRPVIKSFSAFSVFKKVWVEAFSAMMIFVVTLAAFPTLVVLVVSEDIPSIWNDKYYVAVVSFFIFACGDYLGRIMSGIIKLPKPKSKWTLGISIVRLLFIPAIMLSNLHPRNTLPVIFRTDIEFTLIIIGFGLSNGYLANIVFVNAAMAVSRDEQENATTIVTCMLGIGLTLGVTLSYFMLIILNNF